MTRLTRKYEFVDEAAADAAIALLPGDGNASHSHTIIKLGRIVLTSGTYDEDGAELTAPVLSVGFGVDVLWSGEANSDWEAYIVWPSPLGVHSFGSSTSRSEYTATYRALFPDSLYCNPITTEADH